MTDTTTAASDIRKTPLTHQERLALIYKPFPVIYGQAKGHSQAPRLTHDERL